MDKTQMKIALGAGGVVLFFVLIFLGVIPGLQGTEDKPVTLTMWGFEDQKAVWDPVFQALKETRPNLTFIYQRKNRTTFESDFLNALALGQTPDIVVFPTEYLRKQSNKLSLAPKGIITERALREEHIDAAASLWSSAQQTVVGVPLYGDALVLYTNKNMLTKHFFVEAPKTWDQFLSMAQTMTKKDSAGNIVTSGAALGRSVNIKNASDIITVLFLQFGEEIISTENNVVLGKEVGTGGVKIIPADSTLRFFSDFANPKKAAFSWSFALPEAREFFLQERLAFYIGFMSEYETLRAKNPHLDIGLALLPQLTNAPRPVTFGKLHILTVPRAAKNYLAAWIAIRDLTTPPMGKLFADGLKTVFPRRDTIAGYQNEAVRSVFAKSMLALKLWRIPDPVRVPLIFNTMIEDFALGRGTSLDVLRNAKTQLDQINPK